MMTKVRLVTPSGKFLVMIPSRMIAPDKKPELIQFIQKFMMAEQLLAYHLPGSKYQSRNNKRSIEMYCKSRIEVEIEDVHRLNVLATTVPTLKHQIEEIPYSKNCSSCGEEVPGKYRGKKWKPNDPEAQTIRSAIYCPSCRVVKIEKPIQISPKYKHHYYHFSISSC